PIDQAEVPAFPVEKLPQPLRSWVTETAEALQVPSDLPALLGLAALSGLAARNCEILVSPSWTEPINLYAACLLDPANRKSPVFDSAWAPIKKIEAEMIVETRPLIAKADSERRILEGKLKALEL